MHPRTRPVPRAVTIAGGFAVIVATLALTAGTAVAQAAPIVDSGPDMTAPAGTNVVMMGTASDPDGDALELSWILSAIVGSTASCTFTNTSTLTSTLNCTTPGQYLAQLRAFDGTTAVDDTGALVTFTEPVPGDTTPPTCALKPKKHLLALFTVDLVVADPESGITKVLATDADDVVVHPKAKQFDPPVATATVDIVRLLPWRAGSVKVVATNDAGLETTCTVVFPPLKAGKLVGP